MELDIANNLLTEFPRFTSLGKLQILDASHNSITAIPPSVSSFSSLERLYLEHNYLTTVPPQAAELKKIRELMLCQNQITDLAPLMKHLPLLGVSIRSFEGNPLTMKRDEILVMLRTEIGKKEIASIRLIQRIYRSYRLRTRFRNVVRRIVALEAQHKLCAWIAYRI